MSLRDLANLLLVIGGGFALLVLLAWRFQRRLIYLPFPQNVPPVEAVLPGGREIVLRTEDALDLKAWFLPAARERARAAVLLCNGNAGHRGFRAPLAQALSTAGLEVLLFDYRGYGGNPGSPSEEGLLADARSARQWLLDHGARPDRLVYFGESLGTGVAVMLAAEAAPTALILRSPFPSLAAVGRRHYPFLPVRTLLRDRYASIEQIGLLSVPLLVILGERDTIIPADLSRELFEAAREPKRLVSIAGANHNDFELLAGEQLVEEALRFLEEWLPSDGLIR
jgi:fermentation-respiration switch protein FrsA (DUF1100 family)